MVPTGKGRVATSTWGPCGCAAGAATACGAAAPATMLFSMTAVTAAMMRAPINSASFLTSMALVASPTGYETNVELHSSAKLVKKTLANHPQSGECDRDPIGNLQRPFCAGQLFADHHRQSQGAAGQ